MKNNIVNALTAGLILASLQTAAFGQTVEKNVKLHVNPRWSQCSFQLDPSLTQSAWHEFTEEAGVAAYYRPLTDARPMGVGNYEFSLLQWTTTIDDTKSAWNDTFVHPNATHWLEEGDHLSIPGLTFRTGITNRIDAAAYWIKNPGANYGFWGGQVQYNIVNDKEKEWAASARLGFNSLYGPDDLDFTVYGLDFLASRKIVVFSDWVSVAPYVGVSTYVSHSHETSAVVELKDEVTPGAIGMVGAVAQISVVRIAGEYDFARASSFSVKVGVAF